MRRVALGALLCALALLPAASAHSLSVAYLDIERRPDGTLAMELDVSIRDLALTLPLDRNEDDVVTWGELKAIEKPLAALVRARLFIGSARTRCDLRPAGLAIRRYDDGPYAALLLESNCRPGSPLTVKDELFSGTDAQHRTLVTLRTGPRVSTAILTAARPRTHLEAGSARPFRTFLVEGIHHILGGYDHLAFLLSLLLPAALVRRGPAWVPSERLGGAVGGIATIVTAFTAAHSLTLSAAALGWVVPAARAVELAIAASVLVAALNNIWPVVNRRLWLVAFGFGLVHGFGFAGALGEIGLPRGARLASLVGFNLGVELGQLAVVAMVLPLVFAVRRRPVYPRVVLPALSLGIAGVAAYWVVQRVS